MKLITLGVAAALAVGSIGLACATPTQFVTNGDFSATSPTASAPRQFSANSGVAGSPNCDWGGQFVTGWTANTGYGIWYPSAAAASSVPACTQYGNASTQELPPAVTAPTGPGTFIGLDGQPGLNFSVTQGISGLTSGAHYTVSFDWARTQEMSRTGQTTDFLTVSLGSQSFKTADVSLPTHGWSGWMSESFTFVANGTNEALSFLSTGEPANLPPFALLSNVSMTESVPEPPVLAMFGGGLLGLGLLTVFARRRQQRRDKDGDLAA